MSMPEVFACRNRCGYYTTKIAVLCPNCGTFLEYMKIELED